MSIIENGPGSENPSPVGPTNETSDSPTSQDGGVPTKRDKGLEPIPGPGAPLMPEHQNIDANPIDPRVF